MYTLRPDDLSAIRLSLLVATSATLLAGMTLIFARSLGEFGATIVLAENIPGMTQTIPLAIYQYTKVHRVVIKWPCPSAWSQLCYPCWSCWQVCCNRTAAG